MAPLAHLTPADEAYPAKLRALPSPPASVSVDGPLGEAKVVAIVGTRSPDAAPCAFARSLAASVVARGGVVVSGGAAGIDAAAHEGAMDAGGRTWVVAGTGQGEVYPKEHAPLFERVVASGGAMVWPFAPGTPVHRSIWRAAWWTSMPRPLVVRAP